MINSKQSSDRTMGCGAMWIHIGVLAGFHVPMDSQRLKVWSCFDYYGIFIIHSHQYIYNEVQNNGQLTRKEIVAKLNVARDIIWSWWTFLKMSRAFFVSDV